MDHLLANQPPNALTRRIAAGTDVPKFGGFKTLKNVTRGMAQGHSTDTSRKFILGDKLREHVDKFYGDAFLTLFAPKFFSQIHRVRRDKNYKREIIKAFTTPIEHLMDAVIFDDLENDPVMKKAVDNNIMLTGSPTWTKVITHLPVSRKGRALKNVEKVEPADYAKLHKGSMRKDILIELHGDDENSLEPVMVLCLTELGKWEIDEVNGIKYKRMVKYYSSGIPCSSLQRVVQHMKSTLMQFLDEYVNNGEVQNLIGSMKAVQIIRWAMLIILSGEAVPKSFFKLACLSTNYDIENLFEVLREVSNDKTVAEDFSSDFIGSFVWKKLDNRRMRPVETNSYVQVRSGWIIENQVSNATNSRIIKHEIRLARIPAVSDAMFKKLADRSYAASGALGFSAGGMSVSTIDLVDRMTQKWATAKILLEEYVVKDMHNVTTEYLTDMQAPITMLRDCIGCMLVNQGKIGYEQAPFEIKTNVSSYPWVPLALCSMRYEKYFEDFPTIADPGIIEKLENDYIYSALSQEFPDILTFVSENS